MPKPLRLLGGGQLLPKPLLARSKERLPGTKLLPVVLLTKGCQLLGHVCLLPKPLLAKGRHLLRGRKVLAKPLLAQCSKLLAGLLHGGTIGLRGPKADALLLLGRLEGLIVSILVERRNRLRLGKRLLALKGRALEARAVPAKRAGANGFGLLLGVLLPKLLPHRRLRGVHHVLGERGHVLPNLKLIGINRLPASERRLRGEALIGLASLKRVLRPLRGGILKWLRALKRGS